MDPVAFVVGMTATLVVRAVDAAGDPAPPAGLDNVSSWRFVMAEDWDEGTSPCWVTDDVAYDAQTATWTIPVANTRTARMLAALGTDGSIEIGCEIVGLADGGAWDRPAYVLQWSAEMLGRRDSGQAPTPDPATGDVRATELVSRYGETKVVASSDGVATLSRPSSRDIAYSVAGARIVLRWPAWIDASTQPTILSVDGIEDASVSGLMIFSGGEYWGEYAIHQEASFDGIRKDSFGRVAFFFVASEQGLVPASAVGETPAATETKRLLTPDDIPAVPSAATAAPVMDGTANVGSSARWAREDHVHPSDTSRMPATATGLDILENSTTGAVPIANRLADHAGKIAANLAAIRYRPFVVLDPPGNTIAIDPDVGTYRFVAPHYDDGGDVNYCFIPAFTFSNVPTGNGYLSFEIEMQIGASEVAIADGNVSPFTPPTWLDGGELPTDGFAGKTLYIAYRFDCAARTLLANVWRMA